MRKLFPAGQATHDGFAKWAVWGDGIFPAEWLPVVESLFDFGEDADAVILAQSPAPSTGVMIRQRFSLALFFRAFFGGGSFSHKDEHFMAAHGSADRCGVRCEIRVARATNRAGAPCDCWRRCDRMVQERRP